MSHLELLMQHGDINGPPTLGSMLLSMPPYDGIVLDNIELSASFASSAKQRASHTIPALRNVFHENGHYNSSPAPLVLPLFSL